jgi:TPR repeat protein
MSPSDPPAVPPASRTILCPTHNLRYDPLVFAGCVLCRRDAAPPPARLSKRFVLVSSAGIGLLVAIIVALLWLRAGPAVPPPAPARIADAGVAAMLPTDAPPDAPVEEGCVVPFVDSDPELSVPELRHRCDAKDGQACTRLGFACDETAWSRYPRGVLPSRRFNSQTCAEIRTSTKIRQACATIGNKGSWFNVACKAGDWLGCIQPSDPLELEATQRSDDERRTMAESACNRHEVAGCAELGLPFLTKSSGVRAAYARITDQLVACRADGGPACAPSPEALAVLGTAKAAAVREATDTGREAGETDVAAIDALKRDCAAKDAAACVALARASKEVSRAAAFMLRACQLGSMDACLSVHLMQTQGVGGLPDFSHVLTEARRGFELALRTSCSDAGDKAACLAAAKRLPAEVFPGRPRPLSSDAAQNACQSGDPSRCMELARSYGAGRSTAAKDTAAVVEYRAKALSLWNTSCDHGVGASCLAVVRLLSGGPAGSRDSVGAALYAKKGCNDAHDRASCIVLAKMYEDGEGLAKDVQHGKRCMDAAMDFGRATPAGCP